MIHALLATTWLLGAPLSPACALVQQTASSIDTPIQVSNCPQAGEILGALALNQTAAPHARQRAASFLAARFPAQAEAVLQTLSQDGVAPLRKTAIHELGRRFAAAPSGDLKKAQQYLPLFSAALRDADAVVRKAALRALATLPAQLGHEWVKLNAASDPDPHVRNLAQQLRASMEQPAATPR